MLFLYARCFCKARYCWLITVMCRRPEASLKDFLTRNTVVYYIFTISHLLPIPAPGTSESQSLPHNPARPSWPAHADVDVSREVLKDWVSSYMQKDYYQWAIVLKENGNDPIGSISAVKVNDDIDMVHIGYCMGRDWWHQGIMSEALQAVMDFFFDKVGANRIESRHDPRNPHSGMVMKKCGMKYEGTMRSSDRNNQGICDASWYALLRSER